MGLKTKYRKEPKNLDAFNKIFARVRIDNKRLHSINLGKHILRIKPRVPHFKESKKELMKYGKFYLSNFAHNPNAIHLFPMTAIYPSYLFAKGIAKGYGLKINIKTITAGRDYKYGQGQNNLEIQAQRLKLKQNPIVVYDNADTYKTLDCIAKAAGKEKLISKRNDDSFECLATNPSGDFKWKRITETTGGDLLFKTNPRKSTTGEQRTIPKYSELYAFLQKYQNVKYVSKKEHNLLTRAIYVLGIAIGKELKQKYSNLNLIPEMKERNLLPDDYD